MEDIGDLDKICARRMNGQGKTLTAEASGENTGRGIEDDRNLHLLQSQEHLPCGGLGQTIQHHVGLGSQEMELP